MDIETVAHDTPERSVTVDIDPTKGETDADVAKIATALKLDGAAREEDKPEFPGLYKAFVEKVLSLLEVNPLIVMQIGHLRQHNTKKNNNNNSLFRHPDLMELRDLTE